MLSAAEMGIILSQLGVGKLPVSAGPAATPKAAIAQTMPFEAAISATQPLTGVMDLVPIYLPAGAVITNIVFVSGSTAGATITHTFYALYDDGRGSASVGQLALLGQTADQAAAAFAANSAIGLALITPWTTLYAGIYYLAFLQAATTLATLAGSLRASTASIQIGQGTGATYGGTAGSALTNQAPNPSGAITVTGRTAFAYVS